MKGIVPETVDAYIASFPKEIQKLLGQVRATVRKAAPEAEEAIKYAMPTYVLNGNLVHFAAFTNHIGFYPAPTGMKEFSRELSRYKTGKGSVQFPLGEALPLDLIRKVTEYRVRENQDKKSKKAK